MDPDVFDKAIEKLWIHGGALVDFAENITPRPQPVAQRVCGAERAEAEATRPDAALRGSATSAGWRRWSATSATLRTAKSPAAFAISARPTECIGQKFRPLIEVERATLQRIVATLQAVGTNTTGRLHSGLFPNGEMSRNGIRRTLGSDGARRPGAADRCCLREGWQEHPVQESEPDARGSCDRSGGGARILMKDEAATKAGGRKRKKKRRRREVAAGPKPKVRAEARPAEKPATKPVSKPAAKTTPQKAPIESKKEAAKSCAAGQPSAGHSGCAGGSGVAGMAHGRGEAARTASVQNRQRSGAQGDRSSNARVPPPNCSRYRESGSARWRNTERSSIASCTSAAVEVLR